MFGVLGNLFSSQDNEWERRPNVTNTTIIRELPTNATPDQIQRCREEMQETSALAYMSKNEQLDYFKRKCGR